MSPPRSSGSFARWLAGATLVTLTTAALPAAPAGADASWTPPVPGAVVRAVPRAPGPLRVRASRRGLRRPRGIAGAGRERRSGHVRGHRLGNAARRRRARRRHPYVLLVPRSCRRRGRDVGSSRRHARPRWWPRKRSPARGSALRRCALAPATSIRCCSSARPT